MIIIFSGFIEPISSKWIGMCKINSRMVYLTDKSFITQNDAILGAKRKLLKVLDCQHSFKEQKEKKHSGYDDRMFSRFISECRECGYQKQEIPF